MKRTLMLALVALLPSCAMSKNPLIAPDKAQLDRRLLGVWEYVATAEEKPHKGEYAFAFIGKSGQPDAPAGLMEAISVGNNAECQVKVQTPLLFFTTTFERRSYLNLIEFADPDKNPAWDKSRIQGYFFAKYTIQGDNLEVRFMSPDVVKAAIRKGELKGTVEEKGLLKVETIVLTASTDELRQFITASRDEDLFPEKGRGLFKRAK